MNRDPLHTAVCDLFGMETPIFAFTHSLEVVKAVALAGGLPVFGATRHTPEEIAIAIERIRESIGGRPFGVDLVLPSGMPERNDRAAIEDGALAGKGLEICWVTTRSAPTSAIVAAIRASSAGAPRRRKRATVIGIALSTSKRCGA